jgi:hypothetical protein
MQPSAIDVLNGVKDIILTMLVPELQTEQARQQALYAGVLLEHVAARWEIEAPLLREEYAELRAVLTRAAGVVESPGVRAVLAEPDEAPASSRALASKNEHMRRLLPALARALPTSSDIRVRELEAAIRAYIRNQHRRDEMIVQVGALTW